MDVLRTPDDRFRALAGYSFAPHYLESGGIRIHYVDEGSPAAAPVLMLHGEPSWSYLYRKMIPRLTAAGHRVIAPDLVGFGRSDKPAARTDYTYARHVEWMRAALGRRSPRSISARSASTMAPRARSPRASRPSTLTRIAEEAAITRRELIAVEVQVQA